MRHYGVEPQVACEEPRVDLEELRVDCEELGLFSMCDHLCSTLPHR